MKKILAILGALLLLFQVALSEEVPPLRWDDFMDAYRENLTFINQNTGKHLIPLSVTRGNDADGHKLYTIAGEIVSGMIRLDITGEAIEICTVRLTAPEGLSYGDALYNDFTVSGYHSYALLMAMSPEEEPIKRYELVTQVNDLLKKQDNPRPITLGRYRLEPVRMNNTVILQLTADWYKDEEPLPGDSVEIMPDDEVEIEAEGDTEVEVEIEKQAEEYIG